MAGIYDNGDDDAYYIIDEMIMLLLYWSIDLMKNDHWPNDTQFDALVDYV